MVVGPDGKQIMPGSNPNLPQNKGIGNTISNWWNNKGEFQKPGGFQGGPATAPAPAPAQQAPQPVKDGSGNNTNLTTNPNQPGGRPDYAGESTIFKNEESLARIVELARRR